MTDTRVPLPEYLTEGEAKKKAVKAAIKSKKAAKLKAVQDAQKKKNEAQRKMLKKAGKIPKKSRQPRVVYNVFDAS